jgi:ribosomal protein L19E
LGTSTTTRPATRTAVVPEQEMWAHKRKQQRRDLENLRAGRLTEEEMSWFSGGRARACRLLNSPY